MWSRGSDFLPLRLADLEAGEKDATEFTCWQEEMKQVLFQEVGNDSTTHSPAPRAEGSC